MMDDLPQKVMEIKGNDLYVRGRQSRKMVPTSKTSITDSRRGGVLKKRLWPLLTGFCSGFIMSSGMALSSGILERITSHRETKLRRCRTCESRLNYWVSIWCRKQRDRQKQKDKMGHKSFHYRGRLRTEAKSA